MELKLTSCPKRPVIIHGFPGFGMVGAIATEFLTEHLRTEQIGRVVFTDGPAVTAIHEGKLVEPFGIFYNRKYNLVILHAVLAPKEKEWELARIVLELARQLNASEIISLEGVGSMEGKDESRVFFHTAAASRGAKLKKLGMQPLAEGVILGITAALLVSMEKKEKLTCFFAETHNALPDSKAAAKIIESLDKYLKLRVDYQPLLVLADKFEQKLRGIMRQSQAAQDLREKKELSYVG